MATYVLVHGGFHGGWCWERVIPLLEAVGHTVYAPSLSGLAERADRLSPDVGLCGCQGAGSLNGSHYMHQRAYIY